MTIFRGDRARTWLDTPSHRAAWQGLLAELPWATLFQAPPFALAWYESYANEQEPLLSAWTSGHGRLEGLLLLARNRRSGALTHVGAHQAEYQACLTRPEDAGWFLDHTLSALARAGIGHRVTFSYLPADALPTRPDLRRTLIACPSPSGFVHLGTASATADSWRKKSNRSRLRRLEQLGPLTLRRLADAAELRSAMPRIADWCDLRQGATHAVLPFHDDPRKADFHLRLMADGLLHATVLSAGSEPVAYHLGPIDGRTVMLGLTAHSPTLARHSPGKFLLLKLLELLRAEGFARFDLTPGGDPYKERFATGYRQVFQLECHSSVVAGTGARLQAGAGMLGRRLLHSAGINPGSVRRTLAALRSRGAALLGGGAVSPMARRPALHTGSPVYWLRSGSWNPPEAVERPGINRIDHLLRYHPGSANAATLQEFLASAAERLADGHQVHTSLEEGRLLVHGWYLPECQSWTGDHGESFRSLEPVQVLQGLHDSCSRPIPPGIPAALAGRIALARERSPELPIVVQVPGRDEAWQRLVESMGFVPVDPAVVEEHPRGAIPGQRAG